MKKKTSRKLVSLCVIATMGVLLTFSSAFAATPIVTAPVDLSAAGNYAILAETGISTVPDSVITGDIGVSPIISTGHYRIFSNTGCYEYLCKFHSSDWKGLCGRLCFSNIK